MKIIFSIILNCSLCSAVFAQINVLDASSIPANLKEKAHSIKREEKIDFKVDDIDNATLKEHEVYTVMDAEGEDVLSFYEYSSSFRKLEDAEIKVYDAHGKLVNRYKKKEMRVEIIGEGLVDDAKIYYFRVAAPEFPITVQYDYEVKYKGTLNYPYFHIQYPEQSVEYSSYTATVPVNLDLRFKEKNIDIQPAITSAGKYKSYAWEVKNLSAISKEDGTGDGTYPMVMVAPNKFSMDGNEGDLTSWKNFGTWLYNLYNGTVNLSDETKGNLKRMVEGAANDKEKIKIIYNYLQKNFRYVSIQLGIGGYKPFAAGFVDQKKYGDCKALSNYMHACLDAVGIKSYPAIINSDYNSRPVDPSFPYNGFDHVILCVPLKNDTTWLECTSNTSDFGVLGSFTENRNALLVTPQGGVLVATPKSKASENTSTLTTKIKLNEDAGGESESVLKNSGEYKQHLIYLMNQKKDDQKEFLVDYLGFVQPDDFVLSIKKDSTEASFKLLIDKIPEFTAGSKMFLNPRIYKIWNLKLPEDKKRTKDYYFRNPFIKIDTTVYQLPENYTVENLPKPRDNKFEYGIFKTTYTYDDKANTVTTTATLSLTQNIIPADQFELTQKFFSNVIQEYTEKIVIKKR